jgi:hypothetical protein
MPEPEWAWELRMLAHFLMTAGPVLFVISLVSVRLAEGIQFVP